MRTTSDLLVLGWRACARRSMSGFGAGDSGMGGRAIQLVLGLALAMLVGGRALAQYAPHPIPESERWATITHPGNEPYWLPPQFPGEPPRPIGRVDYEYQISKTEVTAAEWFEFVDAYAPYIDQFQADSSLFTSVPRRIERQCVLLRSSFLEIQKKGCCHDNRSPDHARELPAGQVAPSVI